jgi:hypothetical protein
LENSHDQDLTVDHLVELESKAPLKKRNLSLRRGGFEVD